MDRHWRLFFFPNAQGPPHLGHVWHLMHLRFFWDNMPPEYRRFGLCFDYGAREQFKEDYVALTRGIMGIDIGNTPSLVLSMNEFRKSYEDIGYTNTDWLIQYLHASVHPGHERRHEWWTDMFRYIFYTDYRVFTVIRGADVREWSGMSTNYARVHWPHTIIPRIIYHPVLIDGESNRKLDEEHFAIEAGDDLGVVQAFLRREGRDRGDYLVHPYHGGDYQNCLKLEIPIERNWRAALGTFETT